MMEKHILLSRTSKEKSDHERVLFITLAHIITGLYLIFLFFVLPLIYHDKYYDIGRFKYACFFYATLVLLALLFVIIAVRFIYNVVNRTSDPVKLIESLRAVDITDKAVLLYALICFISFFLSPYNTWSLGLKNSINPPLNGYPGWSMGLYSQLMFCALYFTCSRLVKRRFRKYIMGAMFGGSLITYVLAILNRFSIDPLGFYENVDAYYMPLFLSTLGQATWYSSFLCTILPMGLALYIFDKRPKYRIFYSIYIAAGAFSLVTQGSDSAFVSLVSVLVTLFVLIPYKKKYFVRFFKLLVIILIMFRIAGILQILFSDRAIVIEGIPVFATQSTEMIIISSVVLIAYFLFILLISKMDIIVPAVRVVKIIVLSSFLVFCAACVAILILSANGFDIGSLANFEYFVFNETWGNGRGFTWKLTARMFKNFKLPNKLFGVGPDCYSEYSYEFGADELYVKWGNEILENAHNEWFNSMFNLGLIGFLSYLAIFVSAFRDFIRKKNLSPLSIAGACAIIGYSTHNFFCYQQVLCTPFIFAIIGICKGLEIRAVKNRD